MPATITVSNPMPYSGNYQSFRAPMLLQPSTAEGPRTVPVSMTWSTDAVGPDFALLVNLASQRNLQITQICSLYVDNLGNDADVSFYFPDTQFRLDVPAYTVGLFPVTTNGLQFTCYSPDATDGDQTFIQILNFLPPPVSVAKTVFQTPASVSQAALSTGTTDTALYTGAGTLHGYVININTAVASAVDGLLVELTDGTGGMILFATSVTIGTTEADIQVANTTGLDIPFVNGVTLHLSDKNGDITGGGISATVYVSHK